MVELQRSRHKFLETTWALSCTAAAQTFRREQFESCPAKSTDIQA